MQVSLEMTRPTIHPPGEVEDFGNWAFSKSNIQTKSSCWWTAARCLRRGQPPRRAVLPQCTRSSPRLLPQAPLPTAMLTRRPTQVSRLPASAAGGAAPPATETSRRAAPGRARGHAEGAPPARAPSTRAVLGQACAAAYTHQNLSCLPSKFEVPSFSSASTGNELARTGTAYELLQRTPLGLEEYIEG